MKTLKILISVILLLELKIKSAGKQMKLIYEKDVSEHCRRRVMPSIFLGRQVIDANARILQFSRLELPYTCYISIRTESGSSMVMMIQVTSPQVRESCKNSGQLLVYEMGETFGGYWGPLPETVTRGEQLPPKAYTLKTTHITTASTESTTEEEETETTPTTTASSKRFSEQPTGDYVEVVVPLLNVSVHYVPHKEPQTETSHIGDDVDMHNDVTPIPGVSYDTSILPLVQFRLVEHLGGRRADDGDGEPPKYDLDTVQDFTPDIRLTLPKLNPTPKRRHKQKYQATRRLNFKKHRTLFHSQRNYNRRVMSETITRRQVNEVKEVNGLTKYTFPTKSNITINQSKRTQDSWRVIDDLIKKLNKTKSRISKTTLSIKEVKLLERISDMDHKKSVSETKPNISIKTTTSKSSGIENVVNSKSKLNTIATGSLVGHESWENLVQAAPEMIVLLNQTVADVIIRGNASDYITKDMNEAPHKNKMLKRKKRDIHSIAIENAQPHSLTTRKTHVTTTQITFDVADMQEFAQLVELQDDELHGRVALRHLQQFVGPPLFNLCDIPDPTKPHVHLFNSSRIVLSPTNFTLDRMVIILTAARALLTGEMRCPTAKIECQVSGARVCLDSMVACDGVPNCGSYDIYDEDRLMCGHTASLQHNVYLAAFTFLAVLLTIIYSVHYWLKRCVPKVADAFFVYSDGVENVLYLDSIMRSPHDMGEEPKMVYHSHMYGDDIYVEDLTEPYKSACHRFLRKLCCCCRTNQRTEETETSHTHLNLSSTKRIYSFTELEIRKMVASSKDTGVQTGDSLEMRTLEYVKDKKTAPTTGKQFIKPATTSYDFSVKVIDSLLTLEEPLPEGHTDELSLLKFLNAAARNKRNSSMDILLDTVDSAPNKTASENKPQESHSRIGSPSEKEIEIHTYDRHGSSEPGPSKRRISNKEEMPSSSSVNKHLRFDEVTTTIPSGRYVDENYDAATNVDGRHTVVLGEKGRRTSRLMDTIEEADEPGGTKEHRHFWASSKAKKSKKKTHVTLR